MRSVTIRQALQHVADNPTLKTDQLLDVHVHELVSRTLFEIANGASMSSRGKLTKANVARNMIFTRLVGRRRSGSHPATRQKAVLKFRPMAGEIE